MWWRAGLFLENLSYLTFCRHGFLLCSKWPTFVMEWTGMKWSHTTPNPAWADRFPLVWTWETYWDGVVRGGEFVTASGCSHGLVFTGFELDLWWKVVGSNPTQKLSTFSVSGIDFVVFPVTHTQALIVHVFELFCLLVGGGTVVGFR